MIEILQNIWGIVQTGSQFLSNMIQTTITVTSILTTSVTLPSSIVPFLPSILGSSVIITVTIFVAKFLIGR